MAKDDWPPRDSAWKYPEGRRKYGSTGQLWEVRNRVWVRIPSFFDRSFVQEPSTMLFGLFHHKCEDPWKEAPPWAIELREMQSLVIKLLTLVINKEVTIMSTLDEDLALVTAQGTRLDSVNVLLSTVESQLAAALSGQTLPVDVQAKVDAVFAGLSANNAKIDAALNSNVPPHTPEAPSASPASPASPAPEAPPAPPAPEAPPPQA